MRKMKPIAFERMLQAGGLRVPPLDIRVAQLERKGADAVLDILWRDQSYRFVAELKRDAKPQTLRLAIDQVKLYARESGQGEPMIIAPYIAGVKLEQALNEGVSALDFCGNAAIEVPGRFFFFKTGNPNLYREDAPIRSAYRGDGSLVPRVLLLQREFIAVGDIVAAIEKRGGSLTMGAVSKVLKRLEADLVVERPSRSVVRVIQPERLMEGLLDAYQPPENQSTWTGKVALDNRALLRQLEGLARDNDLVRTGESSAGEYAAWAGEPLIMCYCREAPETLLGRIGIDAKETRAFPNLRLTQTSDQRVYFDRRPQLAASPIQSWLEMASGDKRQKEVAAQIRGFLLSTAGGAP